MKKFIIILSIILIVILIVEAYYKIPYRKTLKQFEVIVHFIGVNDNNEPKYVIITSIKDKPIIVEMLNGPGEDNFIRCVGDDAIIKLKELNLD